MIVTLSVDGVSVSAEQFSKIIAALTGASAAVDLTPEQRDQIAALDDPFVIPTNGQPSKDRQHLEVVDLDDDNALARIAFDAYMMTTGYLNTWDDNSVNTPGWRAAAAAVKTAALLQQANRAVAIND